MSSEERKQRSFDVCVWRRRPNGTTPPRGWWWWVVVSRRGTGLFVVARSPRDEKWKPELVAVWRCVCVCIVCVCVCVCVVGAKATLEDVETSQNFAVTTHHIGRERRGEEEANLPTSHIHVYFTHRGRGLAADRNVCERSEGTNAKRAKSEGTDEMMTHHDPMYTPLRVG
jgi:hypothetical protein